MSYQMLKPEESPEMASRSGLTDRVRSSVCFQSLLGFFFNKGVRGGPRVLLNLAGVLVAIIVFVKLLPQHMTESALQSIPIPESVWPTLGSQGEDGVPGGLRVVVFGEIDIGTPVGADEETPGSKSWTQALCDQLACDHHISMVPSPDMASWSISSNDLYAHNVEQALNATGDKDGPGHDYSYLSTTYPPQWKASDLKDQIDKFLAMPKPHTTPASTLWVFSFGLWDVWSLSALPTDAGKDGVRAMTKDIFEQIERLYAASSDPMSIAYSDVNSVNKNTTEEAVEENPENKEEAGPEDNLEKRDEAEAEFEAAAEEEQTKAANSFQILIPRIMDPSLLPGWRDLRPQIPSVHSKAEQMRNSASLTSAWNDAIVDGLTAWVKKDTPEGQDGEESSKSNFETVSPGESQLGQPLRDGFAYNLAEYVLDHILERQMRNAHQTDGTGRGSGVLEGGYRDVRNPCLQPVRAAVVLTAAKSDVALDIPNAKIDHDKQVPSRPTPAEAAAAAAAAAAEAVAAGGVTERQEGGSEASSLGKKEGLAYLSTSRVCEIPGDHLFFTPFALSQRAIQDVAAETAQMIRNGESVRSKLNA